MNKQMLFLLMCVSPVFLNGMFNKPAVVVTVEDLQKEIQMLKIRSENQFTKGLVVAGAAAAVVSYFLPKAKNRFHYGMGTVGAAAVAYGVNEYYEPLSKLVMSNPVVSGIGVIAFGAGYYHRETLKSYIADIKNTSAYKWLFDDLT